MTPAMLAQNCGVAKSTISRLLKGVGRNGKVYRPTLSTLEAITRVNLVEHCFLFACRKEQFMANKGQNKRKDKDRIVLKTGESQRKNGSYQYRWTDRNGNRHYIYAKTLEELREKEAQVANDQFEGIKAEARYVTVNEMFDLWCQLKRGLKNNTFENYKYMYNTFVRPNFGKLRLSTLKKSDVKRFYNSLADELNLQASTIDNIHTVLHQVLNMAVDDSYLRTNPSDNVLKELKQSHVFKTEKRRGLTVLEQELLQIEIFYFNLKDTA